MNANIRKCRKKFLQLFPNGFHDGKYLAWERNYKWQAHQRWDETFGIVAAAYGFHFKYSSKPNWDTYASLLNFAQRIKQDLTDLEPRDMIEIQSFIWMLGSTEYR